MTTPGIPGLGMDEELKDKLLFTLLAVGLFVGCEDPHNDMGKQAKAATYDDCVSAFTTPISDMTIAINSMV